MILYDAKLNLAKLIMRTKHGVATALGESDQLIDTNRNEPDDFFYRSQSNGGAIFFEKTKESRRITDYHDGVFTFFPDDVTVEVGDSYYASPVDWEFYELTQAINMGLEDIGRQSGVPQIDETIPITPFKLYHDLTEGVSNIKRVQMVLDVSSRDTYIVRHLSWDEMYGQLVLDPGSAPTWGDFFRLTYCAPHDEVVDDDDVVSPYINPMLIKWTAAVYALENVDKNEMVVSKLNRAIKTSEAYKTRHPVEMQRDPHLAYFPDEYSSYGSTGIAGSLPAEEILVQYG